MALETLLRFGPPLSQNARVRVREGRELAGKVPELAALDWSGRQDLTLRPAGPERAPEESHSVSSSETAPQPTEIIGDAELARSDGVADSGYVETPFGAPVVREVPADSGPHERLLTVREVAAHLGVCTALVYRLCQRMSFQR
jgi:hypothetical protein